MSWCQTPVTDVELRAAGRGSTSHVPVSDTKVETRHDLAVAGVAERLERSLRRHPANGVDLVPGRRLAAVDRRHPEVPHPLRTAPRVLVPRYGGLVSQRADEARLLLDLAKRALLVALARLRLALRE